MFSEEQDFPQAKKMAYLVWGALLVFTFAHILLAYYFASARADLIDKEFTAKQTHTLKYLLLLISLVELVIFFYLRRKLPLGFVKRAIEDVSHARNTLGAEITGKQIAVATRTYCIIFGAACAGCAMYGLLLVLLGGEFPVIFLLFLLALIGFIAFRPDDAFVERVAAKVREWQTAGLIPGETTDKSRSEH